MKLPLVVAHAGEEVLYVLVPVAVILWLRNVAAQRAEREREDTADTGGGKGLRKPPVDPGDPGRGSG